MYKKNIFFYLWLSILSVLIISVRLEAVSIDYKQEMHSKKVLINQIIKQYHLKKDANIRINVEKLVTAIRQSKLSFIQKTLKILSMTYVNTVEEFLNLILCYLLDPCNEMMFEQKFIEDIVIYKHHKKIEDRAEIIKLFLTDLSIEFIYKDSK